MPNPKFLVLVIDDDTMTCSLIEAILQMENYRTVSANKIGQGGIIALLNEKKPDMLILDFYLGTTATLDYVTAIRASQAWRKLPILMTSAIDHHQVCLEAGANQFLLKPFDWFDITERVNRMRDNLIYQEV
jgi:DNA-binding response OmpR family regulator